MKILLLMLALAARADEPTGSGAPMQDEDAGKPLAEAPLGAPISGAEVDLRTERLASELRCPVCQGLSVAASPSEAARAMRERIRELVALGYGDQQIVDYFVGRYGTWVLLAPPKEGFSWALWLGPIGLVGAGLLFVVTRKSGAVTPAPSAPADAASEADPYRAAVLAELGDIDIRKEGGRPS